MLQRGLPRLALLAVGLACCTSGITAVPTASTSGGDAAASTLFACGSNGEVAADSKQIIDLFAVAKSICCDQLHEHCDDKSAVPTTCHTAGCARVVDVVEQSCAAALADGFLRSAFKPQFDPLVQTCKAAETDPTPTYVISDPALQAMVTTTCHGRVIDGATSSFLTSRTGQDAIVLQAPEGMQIQVAVEMMDLSPHANIRFYDGATADDLELGILRGTSLSDRPFVSSKGLLRVMRVVDLDDDAGLPLIFSLRIGCVCADGAGSGCGTHGSCVNSLCACDEGYGGGMCDTIVDACKAPIEVECGSHGGCVDGRCECDNGAYTGDRCEIFDPCFGKDCHGHGVCISGTCQCDDGYSGGMCEHFDPCAAIHCGAHGRCNENTGRCECNSGYKGSTCEQVQKPCCGAQFTDNCLSRRYKCLDGPCDPPHPGACCSAEECDAKRPGWDSDCDRTWPCK
eukprot:COSAG02_NODE_9959_length_2064_cov_1.390840_1_plen_455_part_00